MKLAVSNIAWTNEEEAAVAELLQGLGVRYVEVAPTKKWENPTQTTRQEIEAYKKFWQSYDIEIVAFQSVLFNRTDLKLFESESNRQATLEYLKDFTKVAGDFGAGVMVFGSPKNRQRNSMPLSEAQQIAEEFFKVLGQEAEAHGTKFCIEPNAPQYACDFITTAQEGIDIVKKVDNPGFRLHLDTACMTLAGDDIEASIKAAEPYLEHFHISSPMLEQVEEAAGIQHDAAARALRSIHYQKFVSIEMKPSKAGENIDRVRRAVQFAQQTYSTDRS